MPDRSATAIARCLRNDLDELLGCFRYRSLAQPRRPSNADSAKVRRRTRPMGVVSDRTTASCSAVFTHENRNQGVSTPFLLTPTF